MKSITKLMVVAMLLVAALVVAPVAARDVNDSGTIYVGEDALNLGPLFDSPPVGSSGTLVYYSSMAAGNIGTVGKTISVANVSEFDLTTAAVGSTTGTWYAFNTTPFTDPTGVGTVLIENPSATLRVLLGDSGTTSVDGQSVTRSSQIRFRIDHNLASLGAGDYGKMQIRVTTPGGGTVTSLGSSGVLNLELTGQRNETGAISLDGLTAGTYTARAVWPSGSADLTDSNAVTFEISSGVVGITANKDSVVRNNAFTVTITGESEHLYWLTIQNPSANNPAFRENQVGVGSITTGSATNVSVNTTSAGTRSVELTTDQNTKAASYTFRVTDSEDRTKYDEVRVRVEAGSISITASGAGTYYVGEEITLSGTNTDSKEVYLFMTGPNLNSNGVNLDDMANVVDTTAGTFTGPIEVEADDTWSHKWLTSDLGTIDSGGYTIYAVSEPQGRNNLTDVKYSTQTIQLRPGFVTATVSSATVARGDDITITGTAQGNPDAGVNIWIFGKNFYGTVGSRDLGVENPTVESDGTFELEITDTDKLVAGQYFAVVQHPMSSGFGVQADTTNGRIYGDGITNVTLTNLQAAEAANALIAALDSPNIDDTYVKLTFFLEDARLLIDAIGDQSAGSTFTISGTTNLAVGEDLIVEVTSAAFQPGQTGQTTSFSSDAGTVTIQAGETMNTWSFEVDGTSFRPDQYIVTVESIKAGITTTGTFNVVEEVPPTTPPVGEVTTPPAGEVTTPPAAETTTEPAPTPGFGALVALAGLGAVAFLVLRRK